MDDPPLDGSRSVFSEVVSLSSDCLRTVTYPKKSIAFLPVVELRASFFVTDSAPLSAGVGVRGTMSDLGDGSSGGSEGRRLLGGPLIAEARYGSPNAGRKLCKTNFADAANALKQRGKCDGRGCRQIDYSAEIRTSRSFAPLAGPTSPRRSIVSTIRAARLYPSPSLRWSHDVEQRRVSATMRTASS